MVTCGQQRVIVPMATVTNPFASGNSFSSSTKPKIAFSIDSIVGDADAPTSLSPASVRCDSPSDRPLSSNSSENNCQTHQRHQQQQRRQPQPLELRNSEDFRSIEANSDKRSVNSSSPPAAAPPPSHGTPVTLNGRPIVVPGLPAGLIRPFPLQPPNDMGKPNSQPLHPPLPPGYMNSPPDAGIMRLPHHGAPNPHFLAAQFQMAAALAHQHGQSGPGVLFHPASHPQFGGGMIRDSYPLYPWLLSRHGRIFPPRFPGNFLLQPFRKPKRIRTAFSPTQLLKLEHAFEGNHYVVGAERKSLAQGLSLTETQVKVWFQNRRTKHKRMQQEGEGEGKSEHDGTQKGAQNDNTQSSFEEDDAEEADEEDDEVIDMDDCASDVETDERDYHQQQQQFAQHFQQHQQQQQQQFLQHSYLLHQQQQQQQQQMQLQGQQ